MGKKKSAKGTAPTPSDGVIMRKSVPEAEIERRLRPIFEALQLHTPKKAIKLCVQAIRKLPGWPAARALKGVAMLMARQRAEAIASVEELRADIDAGRVPIDEDAAKKLTLFYRDLRQIHLAAQVWELAWEVDKTNISLGQNAYSLYIRAHLFSEAQRTAVRLMRLDPRKSLTYTMYGACATWLDIQLKNISDNTPDNFNPAIMLKIAAAKVTKALKDAGPPHPEIVRFAVRLYVDAKEFDAGRELLARDGILMQKTEHIRWCALIEKRSGNSPAAAQLYRKFLTEFDPEDWNTWTQYFQHGNVLEEGKGEAWETIRAAIELAESDRYRKRLRGPYLAKMELLMREAKTEELRDEVVDFFAHFASKVVCAKDLRPFVVYLVNNGEDDDLFEKLKAVVKEDGSTTSDVMLCWLLLWVGRLDLSVEELVERYKTGSAKENNQGMVSDGYITFACHVLLPSKKGIDRYGDRKALVEAVMLLEYGLAQSRYNYHFKILLIVLYMELGYTERGFAVWDALEVKHVQMATLSYLVQQPLFAAANYDGLRDLFLSMDSLWEEIDKELPNSFNTGFTKGSFNTTANIVLFRHRLQRSAFLAQGILVEALTALARGEDAGVEDAWDILGDGSRIPCGEKEADEGLTFSLDRNCLSFWEVQKYDADERLKDEHDDPKSEIGEKVTKGLQAAIFSQVISTRNIIALRKGLPVDTVQASDDENMALKAHTSSLTNGDSGSKETELDPDNDVKPDHLSRATCMHSLSTLLMSLKTAKAVDENLQHQVEVVCKYLSDEVSELTGRFKQVADGDTEKYLCDVPKTLYDTGMFVGHILALATCGLVGMKTPGGKKGAATRNSIAQVRQTVLENCSDLAQALLKVQSTGAEDATEYLAAKEYLPDELAITVFGKDEAHKLSREEFGGKITLAIGESLVSTAGRLLNTVNAMGEKLMQSS